MILKRTLIIFSVFAGFVGVWFLGVRVIIPMQLKSGAEETAAPLDYALPAAWLVRPEAPPPAVWDEGWAFDFFVIPPSPQSQSRHGLVSLDDLDLRSEQLAITAQITELLGQHGAVYMPALRWPSPVTAGGNVSAVEADTSASFQHYLETDNRGRAIVLVSQDTLSGPIKRIASHLANAPTDVQARMAGIIWIGRTGNLENLETEAICSPALDSNCEVVFPAQPITSSLAWAMPPLPGLTPAKRLDDPGESNLALATHLRVVQADFENGVPKLAEPLGALEPVDIPTVRRPGEIDEPLADRN